MLGFWGFGEQDVTERVISKTKPRRQEINLQCDLVKMEGTKLKSDRSFKATK